MTIKNSLDDNNLEDLPSVGPSTKLKLHSIGIKRISDLILFLPSFLIDKTKLTNISDIENASSCLLIGDIQKAFKTKGSKPNLIVSVDVEGTSIQIRFIHKIMIYSNLKPGLKIRFSGIARLRGRLIEFIHPDIEIITGKDVIEKVVPYYKTKKMISQNKIRKLIRFIYEYLHRKNNADIFSITLLKKFKLPHYLDALKYCHFPESYDFDESNLQFELGRQRFILEELLAYKLMLINAKKKYQTNRSHKFLIDDSTSNAFIESLPFKLTQSQQNAIEDIRLSLKNTYPTKRLIQGDVGSGKTVIAAVAAHYATISNLQVAILVPTEILADQHYKTFKQIFSDLPVKISCIKSKIKGKAKISLLDSILHGASNIVIGTHALLEGNVIFKNLGLIIIDEQHKFGIKQRVKLSSNNTKDIHPHEIYLSATPIPRSLSLVLYEGLDYTVVAQMPQGRKTIITKILSSSNKDKLYEHISNTLLSNEQIYWVCSCIDFTESLELEYVAGIFDTLTDKFPSHNIAILHGRNDTRENNKTMAEFINGKIDILVCTTMIEVGIDVPNATCIVIEDSNRFGLSQLHQLRGRVGRSSKQSYCYLICKDEVNDNAMKRLIALEKNSNGFNIAEEDLRLRGQGDYLGIKQSGSHHNFKLATPDDAIINYDIVKDTMTILEDLNTENKSKLIRRWGKGLSESIEL